MLVVPARRFATLVQLRGDLLLGILPVLLILLGAAVVAACWKAPAAVALGAGWR